MYITVSATATSQMQIGGLPFTSIGSDVYWVCPLNHNTTAGDNILRISPANNKLFALTFNNNAKNWNEFYGSIVIGSITYTTA